MGAAAADETLLSQLTTLLASSGAPAKAPFSAQARASAPSRSLAARRAAGFRLAVESALIATIVVLLLQRSFTPQKKPLTEKARAHATRPARGRSSRAPRPPGDRRALRRLAARAAGARAVGGRARVLAARAGGVRAPGEPPSHSHLTPPAPPQPHRAARAAAGRQGGAEHGLLQLPGTGGQPTGGGASAHPLPSSRHLTPPLNHRPPAQPRYASTASAPAALAASTAPSTCTCSSSPPCAPTPGRRTP